MDLKIENLKIKFNEKEILSGIHLNLYNGNIYSLFGLNGAGKSSFFNILLQIYSHNAGDVYYDGIKYKILPLELRQRIGYLSDDGFLINELTARQFLLFVGKLYNLQEPELSTRLIDLFYYFFDELEYLDNCIAGFSTGMKRKLAFCASVIHLPDLLVLDEPFSSLDPVSCLKLSNFLLDYLNKDRLILLSSHNLESSEYLKGTFLILKEGKIVFEGGIDDLTNFGQKQVMVALNEKLGIANTNKISWI